MNPRHLLPRERIDSEFVHPEAIAGNLDDMARLLRALGVGRRVRGFLAQLPPPRGRPLRVLDLAAGSGWLSRSVARWGGARQLAIEVTALDAGLAAVRAGRDRTPAGLPISFARGDALRLPCRPKAFDAVLCTMALHHFDPEPGARLLREVDRAAARGWFVADLLRSQPAWLLAAIATRISSRNPLTRHDGPLSVRRAYTRRELRGMVADARVAGVRIEGFSGICAAAWRIAPAQGSQAAATLVS